MFDLFFYVKEREISSPYIINTEFFRLYNKNYVLRRFHEINNIYIYAKI